MADDDPFAVVEPSEKKMSTYLKKSKDNPGKCMETSSHGTNSTRSTTNSTLPEENNFFASKTPEQSSRKTANSGFNNSASSGSANFDFGNGLEFGQGFGGAGFDDGFGVSGSSHSNPKPKSMRDFGGSDDPFMDSPPKAPKSMKDLGGDTFDAFGSDDPFGSGDPFGGSSGGDGFDPHFEEDEEVKFAEDAFGKEGAFPPPAPDSKDEAWKKREAWKNNARSKSGNVPRARGAHGERRRGGIPRRHHSTDSFQIDSEDAEPSSFRKEKSRRDRERSPHRKREGKGDVRRSPPTRTKSGPRTRRPDHSGHDKSSRRNGESEGRSSRRSSVTHGKSDGSGEPVTRAPPSRTKSSQAPAHRPGGGGRKVRRASVAGQSLSLDFMQMNLPQNQNEEDKEENWSKERSKNQQKIMDMYRDGGMSGDGDDKKERSVGDIGINVDVMTMATDSKTSSSRGRGRKDKKEKKESDSSYNDRQDPKRSKGTLLDRVGGEPKEDAAVNENSDSKGMSYSDRIMAAQKSKR